MAKDADSIAELRNFIQRRQLELGLSRPSSQEVAEQAVVAAKLSVEEVIEARDAESDRGIPAPSRCELSAEEQTELLRRMIEKQKQKERVAAEHAAVVRLILCAKRREC